MLERDDDSERASAAASAQASGMVVTAPGMLGQMRSSMNTNDLASLKRYLDSGGGGVKGLVKSIEYQTLIHCRQQRRPRLPTRHPLANNIILQLNTSLSHSGVLALLR